MGQPYIGVELRSTSSERLLAGVRALLEPGEVGLALVATVKAIPRLTHLVVTDRRVAAFDEVRSGVSGFAMDVLRTAVAVAQSRPSFQQRLFFSVTDHNGEEHDFGNLHSGDAPHIVELVRSPSPPEPPAPVPAPAPTSAPAPTPVFAPMHGMPQSQGWRYVSPPNWPVPPPGWTPPLDWQPDPAWGPAPVGWQFWQPLHQQPVPPPQPAAPLVPPMAQPSAPLPLPLPPMPERRGGLLGGRRARIEELEAENAHLREWVARTGSMDALGLAHEINRLRGEVAAAASEAQRIRAEAALEAQRLRNEAASEAQRLRAEAASLRTQIVETRDLALLQEAGVYDFQHPLANALAYKNELERVKERIKAMARGQHAVQGTTSWQVNGSTSQGTKMVRDFSKLMLRAYNAEADNLVRTMKPYKLQSAIERLAKSAATIERLGKTMDIKVTQAYHELRVQELRLTADYLEQTAREKEQLRAERERQREEERAAREFARERQRLQRERDHNQAALARLEANGDTEAAAELRAKISELDGAIQDVDLREANIRTGYVYVISNIGAFGENMVKIGLTRRLDPMDRVRELGDASVPFRFDVHALIFSRDAVTLEADLHRAFADRRVNQVNTRREFFYATPAEVRRALEGMRIEGNHLLEYEETPEAPEYRASRTGLESPGEESS